MGWMRNYAQQPRSLHSPIHNFLELHRTFSFGMVLDMSAGLIMAGTPPRNATALLTSLKLFFSFSRSSLNSNEGDSRPVYTTIAKQYRKLYVSINPLEIQATFYYFLKTE